MLAAFVGEDNFLKGVSIYLKKRLYGNSITKDLWDGVSEALAGTSSLDVAAMMENWTSKVYMCLQDRYLRVVHSAR